MVIIEFILALLFICLMISLFVSWMIEYLANYQNKKGLLLKKMLGKLLDQEDASIWITKLYQHPMIKSLSFDNNRLTSTIPPKLFSDVLANLIADEGKDKEPTKKEDGVEAEKKKPAKPSLLEKVNSGLATLPDDDFKKTMEIFINKSTDSKEFLGELESWYDDYMVRVNHAYSRLLKTPLFVLGFIIAFAFNIDAMRITTELWQNAPMRSNISGMAEKFMETNKKIDEVKLSEAFFKEYEKEMELPTGWVYEKQYKCDLMKTDKDFSLCFYWFLKILGFLVTGIVASFGAPFWYDALQKIIGLRKGIVAKADGKTT